MQLVLHPTTTRRTASGEPLDSFSLNIRVATYRVLPQRVDFCRVARSRQLGLEKQTPNGEPRTSSICTASLCFLTSSVSLKL